jgi:hypothetical protein
MQQQQWEIEARCSLQGKAHQPVAQPAIPAAACRTMPLLLRGGAISPDQQAVAGQAAAREESCAALHKKLLTVNQHSASCLWVCK